MKKNLGILTVLSLIIILLIFFITKISYQKQSLAAIAQKIISDCKNSQYRPSCYDKVIPLSMDAPNFLTMNETFDLVKLIQKQDTSYGFCHVVAHKIASKEVDKNYTKWKEVASSCKPNECANGCIHGAFQERFKVEKMNNDQIEKIKLELYQVCQKRKDWNPTILEQMACYHGLGHLLMYITNADIHNSVTLCKELAYKKDSFDFLSLCQDATFMQLYQPLEPEDFALIKGKVPATKDIPSFCATFPLEIQASCLRESWPRFGKEIVTSLGARKFCAMMPEQKRYSCYATLFYIIPVQFGMDSNKIISYCNTFPQNIGMLCFQHTARRFAENDLSQMTTAVLICQNASDKTISNNCFYHLAKQSSITYHEKEKNNFCKLLPVSFYKLCMTS